MNSTCLCVWKQVTALTLILFSLQVVAQYPALPVVQWTPRSDWVNVKSDPALTIHATGNGITDDFAAIQQALDLVSTSAEKSVVYLPAGTYRITQTLGWLTGDNCIRGRSLYGCGSQTTVFWDGTTGGTMFLSTGNAKARYKGVVWDGRNSAAYGMYFQPRFEVNPSQGFAEAPMLHDNQAFLNFTNVGLNFCNRSNTEWTGEVQVRNCLFYNCKYGSQIGKDYYNNYEYIFESCHFQDCQTGIDAAKNSSQMVYACRFENSTVVDITGESSIRARHCISSGSKLFFTTISLSFSTRMYFSFALKYSSILSSFFK